MGDWIPSILIEDFTYIIFSLSFEFVLSYEEYPVSLNIVYRL